MKLNKRKVFLTFSFMVFSSSAFAATKADNSKVNKKDTFAYEMTADQQKMNSNDTEITRRIRQDIMSEKDFSIYAQNIKVITVNGVVTLKGPVRTMAERTTILKHARAAVGPANVVNKIAIAPQKTN